MSIAGASRRRDIGQKAGVSVCPNDQERAFAPRKTTVAEVLRSGEVFGVGNNTAQIFTVVRTFIADLSERACRGEVSQLTLETYEQRLRKGAVPHLGHKRLDEVTREDVRVMAKAIRGSRSPDTRNRRDGGPAAANGAVKALARLYSFAEERGLWNGPSPTVGIRPFPVPNAANPLDPSNGQVIFEVCWQQVFAPNPCVPAAPAHCAMFLLVGLTGARRGEIQPLRHSDYNRQQGTLLLRRAKGGKPRTLHLCRDAEVLCEYLGRPEWHAGSPYMFPSPRSASGHVENPEKAWHRLCDFVGVPRVRIHDIRHGFAVAALEATGGNLEPIQAILGHKSAQTTRRYTGLCSVNVTAPVVDAAAAALTGGRWIRVKPPS